MQTPRSQPCTRQPKTNHQITRCHNCPVPGKLVVLRGILTLYSAASPDPSVKTVHRERSTDSPAGKRPTLHSTRKPLRHQRHSQPFSKASDDAPCCTLHESCNTVLVVGHSDGVQPRQMSSSCAFFSIRANCIRPTPLRFFQHH